MIKRICYTHKNFKSRIYIEKNCIVIKFNQKAWLKPYIDMNTELRKNAINDFWKRFFQVDE